MRDKAKHVWLNKVPKSVRKSIVLVTGSLFIIAAAATGWLPGPGGIPLFLIGVAILATEFAWAERFRDRILELIHYLGKQWRAHKIIGTIILICGAAIGITLAIYSFSRL
jgi:hypothetical protein